MRNPSFSLNSDRYLIIIWLNTRSWRTELKSLDELPGHFLSSADPSLQRPADCGEVFSKKGVRPVVAKLI